MSLFEWTDNELLERITHVCQSVVTLGLSKIVVKMSPTPSMTVYLNRAARKRTGQRDKHEFFIPDCVIEQGHFASVSSSIEKTLLLRPNANDRDIIDANTQHRR